MPYNKHPCARAHARLAVTQQLNDGIRMLQMQAHNNSGTINLCHTSCVCSLLAPIT